MSYLTLAVGQSALNALLGVTLRMQSVKPAVPLNHLLLIILTRLWAGVTWTNMVLQQAATCLAELT